MPVFAGNFRESTTIQNHVWVGTSIPELPLVSTILHISEVDSRLLMPRVRAARRIPYVVTNRFWKHA